MGIVMRLDDDQIDFSWELRTYRKRSYRVLVRPWWSGQDDGRGGG